MNIFGLKRNLTGALDRMTPYARFGLHSLRYFYTAVSEPGPGLPQFTVVGYLDDQLFFHFDSEENQAQPRAPWIRAEGPEYWDRQTWIARGWQQAFIGNVRIAMERYNQSGGEGPGRGAWR
ncbi:cobW protein [Platysternon megacephalum]|uniref:CobW protein n=1 Tax=Platysternon megacephalum TaxID=55544 RepID=A0A4D9DF21_9SAUR|nr:cobW protein [Platysternon megacephalum]